MQLLHNIASRVANGVQTCITAVLDRTFKMDKDDPGVYADCSLHLLIRRIKFMKAFVLRRS